MYTVLCKDASTYNWPKQADFIWCDPPASRLYNSNALEPLDYQFALNWLSNTLVYARSNCRLILCTTWQIRRVYEQIMERHFKDFKFENEIIWSYEFGTYTNRRFVNCHSNILVYRLGRPPFYWKEVRVESQRQREGDKRCVNNQGKTPGDVWKIPRVPGNSKTRNFIRTPTRSCQPSELIRKFIRAYTNSLSVILDPFAGTGIVAAVAQEERKEYYGIDINKQYVNEANDMLRNRWKLEL